MPTLNFSYGYIFRQRLQLTIPKSSHERDGDRFYLQLNTKRLKLVKVAINNHNKKQERVNNKA